MDICSHLCWLQHYLCIDSVQCRCLQIDEAFMSACMHVLGCSALSSLGHCKYSLDRTRCFTTAKLATKGIIILITRYIGNCWTLTHRQPIAAQNTRLCRPVLISAALLLSSLTHFCDTETITTLKIGFPALEQLSEPRLLERSNVEIIGFIKLSLLITSLYLSCFLSTSTEIQVETKLNNGQELSATESTETVTTYDSRRSRELLVTVPLFCTYTTIISMLSHSVSSVVNGHKAEWFKFNTLAGIWAIIWSRLTWLSVLKAVDLLKLKENSGAFQAKPCWSVSYVENFHKTSIFETTVVLSFGRYMFSSKWLYATALGKWKHRTFLRGLSLS